MRPSENDFASFYAGYISKVGDDVIKQLEDQLYSTNKLLNSVSEEKAEYRYAEGKWSLKEVVGHMIDTERVMAYRALCIARGEKQSLPGFEQDDYVNESDFNERTLSDLSEEFRLVRSSNLKMFKSFSKEKLQRRGTANNTEVTVLALIFICAGHEKHHVDILKERYIK